MIKEVNEWRKELAGYPPSKVARSNERRGPEVEAIILVDRDLAVLREVLGE